jgi:hypothetical protein
MCVGAAAFAGEGVVTLTVSTPLTFPRTPMDPVLDFGALVREAGLDGVLDPDSIQVIDTATGAPVDRAVTADFDYGDQGRVEWVIADPSHLAYEIRFATTPARPLRQPAAYTPRIGAGDLLRFNNGLKPITPAYLSGLYDLNGDGRLDLVGCWNYAYRPGDPWDGIICYPRTGKDGGFEFGDLTRVRCAKSGDAAPIFLKSVYMTADFADLDGDGKLDLLYSPRSGNALGVFLNSGRRDPDGLPIFLAHETLPRPASAWASVRVVDLDHDGALDFVVTDESEINEDTVYYLRNTNKKGWPIQLAEPAAINVLRGACFIDLDKDGNPDAVALQKKSKTSPGDYNLVWQRNLGGAPPHFDTPLPVNGVDAPNPTALAAVTEGGAPGLLVQYNMYQETALFRHAPTDRDPGVFQRQARAESRSAVMACGDQAWPYLCDWDGDGNLDLLIGGGNGWPRIIMNAGSNEKPVYAEPKEILSDGKPIRLLRNDILGEPYHWHNMGYSYPVYIDWDGDGLPDLMLPNETNRIFWYKNIGTRREPKFGPRLQLRVDAYNESDELRRLSAKRALENTYPKEKEQPFFWRTGAAFADWNGDGLMDFATLDGMTRKLTLFVQCRNAKDELWIKKDKPLRLTDGRSIEDSIVQRDAHWTECFRAVDWDGDGLMDLIYSCAGTDAEKGSIYLLRNVGTKAEPVFEKPRVMRCFGEPIKVTDHGPMAWAGDLDGDGLPDLLACTEWSVYPFYSHAALEMEKRPEWTLSPAKKR